MKLTFLSWLFTIKDLHRQQIQLYTNSYFSDCISGNILEDFIEPIYSSSKASCVYVKQLEIDHWPKKLIIVISSHKTLRMYVQYCKCTNKMYKNWLSGAKERVVRTPFRILLARCPFSKNENFARERPNLKKGLKMSRWWNHRSCDSHTGPLTKFLC